MNNIFSSADILIPAFASDSDAMSKWAVIACDQFTSEPEYWEKCRSLIGSAPSTLDYFMPEAYLGTEAESEQSAVVSEFMNSFDENGMRLINGYIFVKRVLPNGRIRRGIVGKIDLEAYDYAKDSKSPVRATEATVLERIPPRVKIRENASVELPHILILVSDSTVFDYAASIASDTVYDMDLMMGGGHISGYEISGKNASLLDERIKQYEGESSDVVYAMGDGNHSLASAKAHWENVKRETGLIDHPARYALCEITPIDDESLVFEPIYRVLKKVDAEDVLRKLEAASCANGQAVTAVTDNGKRVFMLEPTHALTVGTLQNFIDEYLKENPGKCDYIHGEESLEKLSSGGSIGFLFDGMEKDELFPYVSEHGTLPRKTFSMGEAESKRYYIEMRKIK